MKHAREMAKCHNARVSSGLLYFTEALYRPQVNRVLLNHTVLESFQLLANIALKIFQEDSVLKKSCWNEDLQFPWANIYMTNTLTQSLNIFKTGVNDLWICFNSFFYPAWLNNLMYIFLVSWWITEAFKKLWIVRKAQVKSSASLDQPKVQNTLHLLL